MTLIKGRLINFDNTIIANIAINSKSTIKMLFFMVLALAIIQPKETDQIYLPES